MNTKKQSGKEKNGKSTIKKIIISVLIISLVGGGAYSVWFFIFAEKPGKIEKSGLKEEILVFTFEFMPEIHAGLVALGAEIALSEREIKRIEAIEKSFPDQVKITASEKKIWEKNFSTLNKFLAKHENEIKMLYVAYRVNRGNGLERIKEKQETLKKNTAEILLPSNELTDKLRATEEAKSLLDKIKEKVFKKNL